MLEHQKFVLNAVADNKKLFQKELNKSFQWLNEKEQSELLDWLKKNHYPSHKDSIENTCMANYLNASLA